MMCQAAVVISTRADMYHMYPAPDGVNMKGPLFHGSHCLKASITETQFVSLAYDAGRQECKSGMFAVMLLT